MEVRVRFSMIKLLAFVSVMPSASADVSPQIPRCERLAATYLHCGPAFGYDHRSATFSFADTPRSIPCVGPARPGNAAIDRPAAVLRTEYVPGAIALPIRDRSFNPGRTRFEPLFRAVYGGSWREVRSNLVAVKFLNQWVRFNRHNGAAAALAAVGRDLALAVGSDPGLRAYLEPWLSQRVDLSQMTFVWRNILDTNRMSSHAYGIAIDLYDSRNAAPTYWLWELAKQRAETSGFWGRLSHPLSSIREEQTADFAPQPFVRVPASLIEIFERHKFIWGGKWFFFDAMHFEYRPEFSPDAPVCS